MAWWWPTQLDRIELAVHQLSTRLENIMALVQVEQSALDDLDVALDEATTAIADRIQALVDAGSLPAADVSALQADVENLRALSAPAPVEVPPVV